MHKRRVADDRNDLAEALFPYRFFHAEGGPDARPHAYAGVHCTEWFQSGQGIAADIAGDKDAELRYSVEYAPVRTARAEVGRPHRDLHRLEYRLAFFSGDGAPYDPGIQLSHRGNDFFPFTGDAHRFYMQFDEGI